MTLRLQDRPVWQRGAVLGLVILGFGVVMFLMAEAAVRVRHYVKWGDLWGIEETYAVDSDSGLRTPIPNSEIGGIRINSMGFRSPEIPIERPAPTIRLAFLGGSTTFCGEVNRNEETWPHLIWRQLQARWPSGAFDFINAGVPGYTTKTSLQYLQRKVSGFDPDVIVIYHAVNDLSINSFQLALERGLVERPTDEEISWPSRYSLLWYLVEKNLDVSMRQLGLFEPSRTLTVEPELLTANFRTDLSALVRASQKVASVVVLVTQSHHLRRGQTREQQAQAAITALYYMPYFSADGVLAAVEAYNDVIREVALETGALLVGNEASIPGDPIHFVDSVHFSQRGSFAMAERVGPELMQSEVLGALVASRSASEQTALSH